MTVAVDIDDAKDKHDCFILNSEGKSWTMCFLSKIQSCTTVQDKIEVELKATGHDSYNLLGFPLDNGLVATYVLNPLQTNIYRKSLTL